MVVFKLKLVRPSKHVMLEMTEGTLLAKGKWQRNSGDSNSALQFENGFWENWILGSPGGSSNIRLYSPDETKSALIKNFTSGVLNGSGSFIIDTFGGQFGDDDFQWFRF